jgi:hypothetical protein
MAADVEGDEPMDQRIAERRGRWSGSGNAKDRQGRERQRRRRRRSAQEKVTAERKSARRERGRMAGVGEEEEVSSVRRIFQNASVLPR